ncbi:Laminin subunit alpha-2 [Acipenser ruthenus]|uniref:Laminin subunit alpha-2 n=1 Tax=Acipenser ruthenus TaxID=7906 RepID=A0A662YW78_ACIRT|nr:Laminin subunit alpha-2 [Acipenser ruthenus]
MDGDTFEPWQYFAITDTECLTRFNILLRTGPPSYTKDDDVICTSFYSKIPPLENGECIRCNCRLDGILNTDPCEKPCNCKPCDCNVMGSLTLQCNSDTGCCFCRPGFAGEKCTECKEGYRDFPQ